MKNNYFKNRNSSIFRNIRWLPMLFLFIGLLTSATSFAQNAPVANDDANSTSAGTTLNVVAPGVLLNDSDADGDPITVSNFVISGTTYPAGTTASLAGQGDLTINADGSYTFVPAAGFNGAFPNVTVNIQDNEVPPKTDSSILRLYVEDATANLAISISSCNQGFIQPGSIAPNGTVMPNGAYKITYSVSITNASQAFGYNASSQITNIAYFNDLEAAFGDGTIYDIDITSVGTSAPYDGEGGYYPQDWDLSDIDTNEYSETDATPGQQNCFLAASTANNVLYPRQTIGIRYCIYVNPDYVGDPNVQARSYPDASGSGIHFDNTVSATSSDGNPTDHIDITDFHTQQSFIAAALHLAGNTDQYVVPVNTDGTYTFTNDVVIKNDGTTTANDVNYNYALGNWIDNGINFTTLSLTSTGATVALNPNFDGYNDPYLLAPNQSLNAGDEVTIHIYHEVAPTTNGNWYYFENPNPNMTLGPLDVFDETSAANKKRFSFVTWSDADGAHVDRYDETHTLPYTPSSDNQCACEAAMMRFPYTITISVDKSIVSDVPAASGTPGNRDVTFRLKMYNSSSSTVHLEQITLTDDLSAICPGNLVQVFTPPTLNHINATTDPNINAAYDGVTDINVLDGTSGILDPGQEFWVDIKAEIKNACGGTNTATYGGKNPEGETVGPVTASVAVSSVNTDPTATDNAYTGTEDNNVTGNIITDDTGDGVDSDVDGDPLSVTQFVVNGTTYAAGTTAHLPEGDLTINSDGTFTFAPAADYNGPVPTATYTVDDGNGGTATADLDINITPVNDDPVANDDTYTTNEDTPLVLAPLANDSDPDAGDTLTVTDINGTAITPGTPVDINVPNGTVHVDAAGNITFTPDANYNGGPITFPYTISDGNGGTDTATITINVTPVNDDPVATDNVYSGQEDNNVTGNIILDDTGDGVDSDPDTGDTLSVTQFVVGGTTYTVPAGGSATAHLPEGDLTINSDGSFTFVPAANYNGPVPTATYTVDDGNGGTDTADLDINIIPVNDPPVATNDTYTATEDMPLVLAPLTNDNDIDGDPLTVTHINGTPITPGTPVDINVPNGTVHVDATGNITFTPDPNYNGGPITFPYTISDGNGGTDTANITINVTPVNDPPVATDNTYNGTEDNNVTGNVMTDDTGLGQDSDVDGDALTLTQFVVNGNVYPAGNTATIPGVGDLTINADGSFTFVPEPNYNGTVPTATYTITDGTATDSADLYINIASVNDNPVATDDSTTTMIDTPVTFNATDNDTDIDGTIDTTTVDLDPSTPGIQSNYTDANGNQWSVDNNGDVTFTPAPGFAGTATIPYTVNDNEVGTSNLANLSVFVQNPEVTVTKDDGMPYGAQTLTVGQVITYTVIVSNTGNVDLTDIALTDAHATLSVQDVDLAAGASTTVTATHTVTQADIDNGSIENTVTAQAFFNGTPVTDDSDDTDPSSPAGDDDPTVTTIQQNPELIVTKDDAIPANATVGDDIVYTIVVTNSGNVTLDNIVVTDPNAQIGGNNTIATLAPGAFVTLTATHTITQADMNNGGFDNVATASTTFNGNPVTDDSDDPAVVDGNPDTPTHTDLTPYQIAELTATLDDNDPSSPTNPSTYFAGDNINYTLFVENTGNVSITNPTPPAGYTPVMSGGNNVGDTNGDGILDPGEVWQYTGSHTLTQPEIDAGVYTTQVSVSGDFNGNTVTDSASDDPQTNADNDPTNTYFNLISEISIDKVDTLPLFVMVGQDITYDLIVSNNGNTTLSNVTITDTNAQNITYVSGDANSNGTMEPGEVWHYSATHTITQADMDAGAVANTASVTANDPSPAPVTDDASNDPDTAEPNDPTVSDLHPYQDPSMTVTKDDVNYTDNGLAGASAGDVITYEIAVQNTGNITLNSITVIDMMLSNAGVTPVYSSGDLDNDGYLDVNETWVYTADYTVTQSDMDAGQIVNSATGYGLDSNGVPLFDVSDDPNFIPSAGDPDTDENPTVTNLPQAPELTVTKDDNLSLTPPPTNLNVGDVITYTIVVTNTGNVTIDNVDVTDTNATMNGVGSTPALAPGDSVTFTAVHTITQDDMNNGGIDNQATASGTDPNNNTVSDVSDDPETTTVPDDATHTDLTGSQTTGIAVTLDDNLQTNPANPYNFNVGDVITYTAAVTNTGNVSVNPTTPAGYTPVEQGGVNVGDTNGNGVLDPGETWVYTTTHTVTQTDIDTGHVDNQVTFEGTALNGDAVSDVSDDPQDQTTTTDDVTVTYIGQLSELTVIKTGAFNDANANGLADVGETIVYTITVTNTGNLTITNVQVTDPNAAVTPPANQVDLLPGESYDFTATHILTQADIDAGEVENQATATGNDPANNLVSDISDDPNTGTHEDATIVQVPVHAELTMTKTGVFTDANGNGYADIGEVLTYTFEVSNAGNQTVYNISIDDADLTAAGAVYVSGDTNGNNALDVGEVWTYSGVHELTQADIDAGSFDNQAIVNGEDPQGNTLTDLSDDPNNATNADVEGDNEPDDITTTDVPQHPELSLLKTGVFNDENGNGLADIGETISYNFTVTNIGNVTLTDVEVTDALPGVSVSGTPIILAPGASDNTTFTAVYTLTATDIDNGFVSNSALVTGTDPQGNDTTDVSDDPNNPDNVDPEGDNEPDDPTVIETLGLDIMTIFTPNGDGTNDTWDVLGIQNFPNNTVRIYNRWGNLVYEKEYYTGNWDGTSNGRWTVSEGSKLPVGTYFYVIDLGNGHKPFTGYLYLNR